jgi:hypothetical protein
MDEEPSKGQEPSKPHGPRFREIGPAWITAIAALIAALAGAGFFAGRVTASNNSGSSPIPQSTSRLAGPISSAAPAISPSPVISSPETDQSSSGENALLDSYNVTIPANKGIKFGSTPGQPESCTPIDSTDDLCYDGYEVGSDENVAVLDAVSASYEGCETDTNYQIAVSSLTIGTILCFTGSSPSNLVASATIMAFGQNDALMLKVNVYKGS